MPWQVAAMCPPTFATGPLPPLQRLVVRHSFALRVPPPLPSPPLPDAARTPGSYGVRGVAPALAATA